MSLSNCQIVQNKTKNQEETLCQTKMLLSKQKSCIFSHQHFRLGAKTQNNNFFIILQFQNNSRFLIKKTKKMEENEHIHKTQKIKDKKAQDEEMKHIELALEDENFIKIISQESSNNQSPQYSGYFWLNVLVCYPSDALKDNMLTFQQIMFENFKKIDKNEPRKLISAFMTTFGFSTGHLEPLAQGNVQLVVVNHYGMNEKPSPIIKNYQNYSNWTIIHPPKNSDAMYGAFHPKLWMLKFPSFLSAQSTRIVIGSGNLTELDWILWSNCFFYQDFPLINANSKTSSSSTIQTNQQVPAKMEATETIEANNIDIKMKKRSESFYQAIENIISRMITPGNNFKTLMGYEIKDYKIEEVNIEVVESIPGRYSGTNFANYGLSRVRVIMKEYSFSKQLNAANIKITYQTSSLGLINYKFLESFLTSFVPQYSTYENLNKKKYGKQTPGIDKSLIAKKFQIIFPTEEYVKTSDNKDIASCLILNEKHYQDEEFFRDCLYQFQSNQNYAFNQGIIPHLKVCIISNDNGNINDDTIIYFGSHNFTPSAWGRFEKNFEQISINNTELGVIIPPMNGSEQEKKKIIENLPFEYPPKQYTKSDKPFIKNNCNFQQNFPKLEILHH